MFQYDGMSYRPMIDIKTVNLDMLVKFNNQVLTLSYNSPTNSNSQIAYGTK